jgi:hypothetical protein
MHAHGLERKTRRAVRTTVIHRVLAPIVRDVVADRRVQAAAAETYSAARTMYGDVRGIGAKRLAGQIARDERLQSELGALVRSATAAVDTGRRSGHRQLRRRIVPVVVLGSVVGYVVGVRLRSRRAAAPPGAEPHAATSGRYGASVPPIAAAQSRNSASDVAAVLE